MEAPDFSRFRRSPSVWKAFDTTDDAISAWCAYNGSLDAAMALHNAVLPGWVWSMKTLAIGGVRVWTDRAYGIRGLGYIATNSIPARALVLVDLEALIEKEKAND